MKKYSILFNKKGYQYLFDKYYTHLRSYAYQYVGDLYLSDDIIQSVFMKFWQRKMDFVNEKTVASYLFNMVRNSCLNHIRDEKRKPLTDLEECDECIDEFKMTQDILLEIKVSIDKLSSKEKEVVNSWMNGLSHLEIAEEMEISLNTIKTLKKRAYRKLRSDLKGLR
ncbi:sigma-70 family RNA polymerase sigma factor [Flavobacteriaceae bacterium]|nr:sigma-70 family RNA polymerase sigma factor [Flavobacteriaceae bacterium]